MTGRYYVQDLRERDVVEFDDVGIEVREHKHAAERATFWICWKQAGGAMPHCPTESLIPREPSL
jgi:hypothetical protein